MVDEEARVTFRMAKNSSDVKKEGTNAPQKMLTPNHMIAHRCDSKNC